MKAKKKAGVLSMRGERFMMTTRHPAMKPCAAKYAVVAIALAMLVACNVRCSAPLLGTRSLDHASMRSTGAFANSDSFKPVLEDSLSALLDTVWNHAKVASISVAVGVPGKGLWTAQRQIGDMAIHVSDTTVYHAESTGKMYTAAVIFKLIEDDVLSLDSTLAHWFPELPRSDMITVRHLLTHTSGIPSFDQCPDYIPQRYYEPMEKVRMSVKYPYKFQPGAGFSYSNTGYILLGLIAEKATGNEFSELLVKYVINPLGLSRTFPITKENKNSVFRMQGYREGKRISSPEDYTAPAAAGMIASTPTDVVLFFQALMSGRLLSEQSLKQMFTDMVQFPDVPNPAYYGKGIMAYTDIPAKKFPRDLVIEHDGGSSGMGFYCYPIYVPSANLFVCVMTNDSRPYAEGFKYGLAYCALLQL